MPTTHFPWVPLTADGWDCMPRLVEELPPTWDQSWTRVPRSWASQGRGGVWGVGCWQQYGQEPMGDCCPILVITRLFYQF